MPRMLTALLPLLMLSTLAARADDTAAAVDDPALAPHHCTQPALPSEAPADSRASHLHGKDANADLNQQVQAYQACMRAYVDLQGELSRKHIAAANAAVKEVNEFGQKLNAER